MECSSPQLQQHGVGSPGAFAPRKCSLYYLHTSTRSGRRRTGPLRGSIYQDAKKPGGPRYHGALLLWCPPIRIRSTHIWTGQYTATYAWHSRTIKSAQAALQGQHQEYLWRCIQCDEGRTSSRLLSPSRRGGLRLGVAIAVHKALETLSRL